MVARRLTHLIQIRMAKMSFQPTHLPLDSVFPPTNTLSMKCCLFFFSLLLILSRPASAQQAEFAPIGAEWFYFYQSGWGLFEGFAHAQSLGDTLLNGRVCKKVCTSSFSQPTTPPYCNAQSFVRYLHQRADSIFECGPDPAYVPRLLFRTNFQVGDSLYNYYRAYVVTHIDTVTLNNQPVRRFHLDDGFGTFPVIYDRFGPHDGLFDFSWGVIADGPVYQLRCYQDNHFPQVQFSSEACDFILPTEEPLSRLHIYPNPVRDLIDLEFLGDAPSNMRVQIWDAAGRLLQEQALPANREQIDVQMLPAGFYVLTIQAGEARGWRKFVKQ